MKIEAQNKNIFEKKSTLEFRGIGLSTVVDIELIEEGKQDSNNVIKTDKYGDYFRGVIIFCNTLAVRTKCFSLLAVIATATALTIYSGARLSSLNTPIGLSLNENVNEFNAAKNNPNKVQSDSKIEKAFDKHTNESVSYTGLSPASIVPQSQSNSDFKKQPEAKFNASTNIGKELTREEEIELFFGDEPVFEDEVYPDKEETVEKPSVLGNIWAMKSGDIDTAVIIETRVTFIDNSVSSHSDSSLKEVSLQENQSLPIDVATSSDSQNIQTPSSLSLDYEFDTSPGIDIALAESLFDADVVNLESIGLTASAGSAVNSEQFSSSNEQDSVLILTPNLVSPTNNNSSTTTNTFSIFSDDEELESIQEETEQSNDELSSMNLSSTIVETENFNRFSWLEKFDGPGLDLNRFVTPGSRLSLDREVLQFSLDAIHAGRRQDEVRSSQVLSLNEGVKKIETALTVVDVSRNESSLQSAPSIFKLEVPLERVQLKDNESPSLSARMILNTDAENTSHAVTLGIYEQIVGIDGEVVHRSLGETNFFIGKTESTGEQPLSMLNFSLNTEFPNRIDLAVNENRLSIPIAVGFPKQLPVIAIDLSAGGASGEYSRIDASLLSLLIDDRQVFNISDRIVLNDSTATLGHSLRVQDSAVRISAGNSSLEQARVVLATRADFNDIDLIREVDSTDFTATISIKDLNLNDDISRRNNSVSRTSFRIVHALFEAEYEGENQLVAAVLHMNPTNKTDRAGLQLGDIKGQLVRIKLPFDENIDWHTALKSATMIANVDLGEDIPIQGGANVQVMLLDDLITFSWGNLSTVLKHDFDMQWFPSLVSSSAVIVESNMSESIELDVDNIGYSIR